MLWDYSLTCLLRQYIIIVVTFGLSFSILMGVTLLGFITFKFNFLSILMPGAH